MSKRIEVREPDSSSAPEAEGLVTAAAWTSLGAAAVTEIQNQIVGMSR